MRKTSEITLRQSQAVRGSEDPSGSRRGDGERSRTITKEMKISEVVQKNPKTTSVFIDYGLHCIGCPMAAGESSETIEEATKVHHIDLKKFLKDLNKAVK